MLLQCTKYGAFDYYDAVILWIVPMDDENQMLYGLSCRLAVLSMAADNIRLE